MAAANMHADERLMDMAGPGQSWTGSSCNSCVRDSEAAAASFVTEQRDPGRQALPKVCTACMVGWAEGSLQTPACKGRCRRGPQVGGFAAGVVSCMPRQPASTPRLERRAWRGARWNWSVQDISRYQGVYVHSGASTCARGFGCLNRSTLLPACKPRSGRRKRSMRTFKRLSYDAHRLRTPPFPLPLLRAGPVLHSFNRNSAQPEARAVDALLL